MSKFRHYINVERSIFTAWKNLLHGFDNRIEPENPKFKANIENKGSRTLRNCFLAWKQGYDLFALLSLIN